MKTLTQKPELQFRKSALLVKEELRCAAAIETFEYNPTRETLDKMEVAAIVVANQSRKEGIPISAEIADIVQRAKEKKQIIFSEDPQGRRLDERETAVFIAVWLVGLGLFMAACFGIYRMIQYFFEQ